MKSMEPLSVACFYMTYFYRAGGWGGGGGVKWPPRLPGSTTDLGLLLTT